MKKYIVTIIVLTIALFQVKAQTSRPPWVVGDVPFTTGELPYIDIPGNYLRVVFAQDVNPEIAESKGEQQLVRFLLQKAGLDIKSSEKTVVTEHVMESSPRRSQSSVNHRTEKNITVDGKSFGRYCLVDRYVERKGGRYYFAGLYLVAEKNTSLASLPPLEYAVDKGAWRSLIVPGWGQFYQGRTGAGIAFLGAEAALIGTACLFQQKVNVNLQRMEAATSIEVKEGYKQRYDQVSLYRNISVGACVAWYAFNAIDAFSSKKGKLYYTSAYGNRTFSLAPVPVQNPQSGDLGLGLALNIEF